MMEDPGTLSLETIREQLTPERVRSFQVLYAALVGGTMLFLVVIFFFYGLGSDSPPAVASDESLRYLAYVLIFLAPMGWIMGMFLYRSMLSRAIPVSGQVGGSTSTFEAALNLLRTAMILRLALFEGPALFGLVICLIGITDGVLFHYPLYIFSIAPACVFLFLIGTTFPTHERIANEIRSKIIEVRR